MTEPARCVIAVALALAAAQAGAAPIAVRALDPGIAGAAAEASVAADGGRGFVLSWQAREGDGGTALRFRRIGLDGERGEIGEIARGRGWFANWADFPSLTVLDDGDWLAHWLERSGPGRYAYDIRIVRSRDGGATWSAPLTPHDDGTQSEHGFVSWVPSGGNAARAIWLDGRHTGAGLTGREGHDHGGAMTLRSARIGREGVDDGAELDGRVCDCCQTDAVRIGTETLVVYRGRDANEVRDVRYVRHDGKRWQPSQPLFADGWIIHGCPVNGPALAAHGRDVAAAAYSGAGEVPRVKLRTSRDGGRRWHDAVTIAEGATLGRLDLAALPGGRFLLSRIDEDGDEVVLRLSLLGGEGAAVLAEAELARLPADRLVGFPRLAAIGERALVAWTETRDRAPHLRTALITLDDRD